VNNTASSDFFLPLGLLAAQGGVTKCICME
jgi:hypothetical protein